VLWWEILRLVNKHKPRFIFLENVDRLLKSPASQKGRDFAVMLRTLGDAGYFVEWRIVNAAEYGNSQRRIRVFIVAKKVKELPKGFDPLNFLIKTGVLARAFPVSPVGNDIREVDIPEDPTVITKTFGKGLKMSPFLNSGFYHDGIAYTIKVEAKFSGKKSVLKDVLLDEEEVPEEFWIPKSELPKWEFLKGAKSIERIHKASGTVYNYAEGKMAFPDLVTNPSRTILTAEGGSTPSRFKHIIKTKKGYRRLTPIELERLNGFPDDWTKFDKHGKQMPDTRRAFFMGNALVIPLIAQVGKILAKDLKS
jgi:DNA (cytosine-5)-methyltransferase 1